MQADIKKYEHDIGRLKFLLKELQEKKMQPALYGLFRSELNLFDKKVNIHISSAPFLKAIGGQIRYEDKWSMSYSRGKNMKPLSFYSMIELLPNEAKEIVVAHIFLFEEYNGINGS